MSKPGQLDTNELNALAALKQFVAHSALAVEGNPEFIKPLTAEEMKELGIEAPAAVPAEQVVNTNPFGEAVGLTSEVEAFTPSAPVMNPATAMALVQKIDGVIQSGSVRGARGLIKHALGFVTSMKLL